MSNFNHNYPFLSNLINNGQPYNYSSSSTSNGQGQSYNYPSSSTSNRQGQSHNYPSSSTSGQGQIYNYPSSSTSGQGQSYTYPSSSTRGQSQIYNYPSTSTSGQRQSHNYPSSSTSGQGQGQQKESFSDIMRKLAIIYKDPVEGCVPAMDLTNVLPFPCSSELLCNSTLREKTSDPKLNREKEAKSRAKMEASMFPNDSEALRNLLECPLCMNFMSVTVTKPCSLCRSLINQNRRSSGVMDNLSTFMQFNCRYLDEGCDQAREPDDRWMRVHCKVSGTAEIDCKKQEIKEKDAVARTTLEYTLFGSYEGCDMFRMIKKQG